MNIAELEQFFKTVAPPKEPIVLSQCETILNFKLFVKSHLEIIKTKNKIYMPYYRRLLTLKTMIQ